jgi:hypothetical protein
MHEQESVYPKCPVEACDRWMRRNLKGLTPEQLQALTLWFRLCYADAIDFGMNEVEATDLTIDAIRHKAQMLRVQAMHMTGSLVPSSERTN